MCDVGDTIGEQIDKAIDHRDLDGRTVFTTPGDNMVTGRELNETEKAYRNSWKETYNGYPATMTNVFVLDCPKMSPDELAAFKLAHPDALCAINDELEKERLRIQAVADKATVSDVQNIPDIQLVVEVVEDANLPEMPTLTPAPGVNPFADITFRTFTPEDTNTYPTPGPILAPTMLVENPKSAGGSTFLTAAQDDELEEEFASLPNKLTSNIANV